MKSLTATHRATLTLHSNARRSDASGSRVARRAEHEPGKVTFRNRVAAPQPIQYQHAAP